MGRCFARLGPRGERLVSAPSRADCGRIPPDWPHRTLSRCLRVGAIDWHVQVAGRGPTVLLLHGTGSSSHSWADVLPLLTASARVVVPDLPGHGHTLVEPGSPLALAAIAQALEALVEALAQPGPLLVAGHSAGAAIALHMALGPGTSLRHVVGFAPSLVPPPALYMALLAPLVTPVATSPRFTGWLATMATHTRLVNGLLDSTRSTIPQAQRERYAALFRDPAHVQGTMRFMAAADLPHLLDAAAALTTRCTFVLGAQDPWVPEHALRRVAEAHFPRARLERWEGGHLLHEAEPERAARRIATILAEELRLA